jgi:hypothetical protein
MGVVVGARRDREQEFVCGRLAGGLVTAGPPTTTYGGEGVSLVLHTSSLLARPVWGMDKLCLVACRSNRPGAVSSQWVWLAYRSAELPAIF